MKSSTVFLAVWLSTTAAAGVVDSGALEARLDALLRERMEAESIPGVVVAVVESDEVVLTRGWGFADLEQRVPMDAEATLVRVASISKTFTATAAAQLEARGVVDLDADVNTYLRGVAVPDTFAEPVTLRHLLSHTSGFINHNVGRVSLKPQPPDALRTFLTRTMPPRLYPPDTVTLYTNHGNALAGQVLADAVDMPFHTYIRHHLLDPLEMSSTTYFLDEAAEARLAMSYVVDDGRVTPHPYLHFNTVPASAIHTTARDMCAYMIMHLGGGRFRDRQVLDPAAAARMTTPRRPIHPAIPSYHYAFYETPIRGYRARSHGGSVPAFLSVMALFDEAGLGVFVAQNAFGTPLTVEVAEEVVASVLPRRPAAEPPPPRGDGRVGDAEELVGAWRVLRKKDTPAFTRARALLLDPPAVVAVDAEGFLTLDHQRFVRVDDLVFTSPAGDGGFRTLVFTRNANGAVSFLHLDQQAARRVPWHASRWLQFSVYATCLTVLLAGLALGVRRSAIARFAAVVSLLALGGVIVPHVYVTIVDAGQPTYLQPLRFGMPSWLAVMLLLPRFAAVLALGLAWMCGWSWLRGRGPLAERLAAAGVCLAVWILAAIELYWRTPPPGLLI